MYTHVFEMTYSSNTFIQNFTITCLKMFFLRSYWLRHRVGPNILAVDTSSIFRLYDVIYVKNKIWNSTAVKISNLISKNYLGEQFRSLCKDIYQNDPKIHRQNFSSSNGFRKWVLFTATVNKMWTRYTIRSHSGGLGGEGESRPAHTRHVAHIQRTQRLIRFLSRRWNTIMVCGPLLETLDLQHFRWLEKV